MSGQTIPFSSVSFGLNWIYFSGFLKIFFPVLLIAELLLAVPNQLNILHILHSAVQILRGPKYVKENLSVQIK